MSCCHPTINMHLQPSFEGLNDLITYFLFGWVKCMLCKQDVDSLSSMLITSSSVIQTVDYKYYWMVCCDIILFFLNLFLFFYYCLMSHGEKSIEKICHWINTNNNNNDVMLQYSTAPAAMYWKSFDLYENRYWNQSLCNLQAPAVTFDLWGSNIQWLFLLFFFAVCLLCTSPPCCQCRAIPLIDSWWH